MLTVTDRKAFIWVESLEIAEMGFNCIQSFDIAFDAHFVETPKLSPRADLKHIDLRYDCSKLFHSFRDTEKHVKNGLTTDNAFGIVPSGLGGNTRAPASIDWVLLLMQGFIMLTQCKGLRNVPQVEIECRHLRKIYFSADLSENVTLNRIVSSAMCRAGQFDDTFNFTAMNDQGTNLFKCTVSLANSGRQDESLQPRITAELNAAIRVSPGELSVTQMLMHPYLPLVALVYSEANLIEVYRLEDLGMASVHEQDFILHGNYKHTSDSRKIIDAQWVGDLDQLLVVTEQGSANAP